MTKEQLRKRYIGFITSRTKHNQKALTENILIPYDEFLLRF